MRLTSKMVLLALGMTVALALAATPALAQTAQIEEHGEEYGGGDVGLELASPTVDLETADGELNCNELSGGGNIDESMIDGETEVGELDGLTFSQNGSHVCPTTFSGISACEVEVNAPWDVSVEPVGGSYALRLPSPEVEYHCNTIVGVINCHYEASELTMTFGEHQEVGSMDEHFVLTSGGFLCLDEMALEADVELDDSASGEHLSIEAL